MESSVSEGDPQEWFWRGSRMQACAGWDTWSSRADGVHRLLPAQVGVPLLGGGPNGLGNEADVVEISSDSSETEDSDDERGHLSIKTRLYPPCTTYLELLGRNLQWGVDRWLLMRTKSGRAYKVYLERKRNRYVISKGWDLVVLCEGLHVWHPVRFDYDGEHLSFRTRRALRANVSLGFARAWEAGAAPLYRSEDYVVSRGTVLSHSVLKAMYASWNSVESSSRMYVCAMNDTQVKSHSMYFNAEYGEALPEKKETVALRLIGSPVAICASIHMYGKGQRRLTQGWKPFVEEHRINPTDVLVFRYFRGPAVWEFLIGRA